MFGRLGFMELYAETADHATEVSDSEAHVDYLGLPWVYFFSAPNLRPLLPIKVIVIMWQCPGGATIAENRAANCLVGR